VQRFYGGCGASNDIGKYGDHVAGKNGDYDVCENCCRTECRRLVGLETISEPAFV
jgi:hypothetical protein